MFTLGQCADQYEEDHKKSCEHRNIVGGNDCRWCAECGTDFEPHIEELIPLSQKVFSNET